MSAISTSSPVSTVTTLTFVNPNPQIASTLTPMGENVRAIIFSFSSFYEVNKMLPFVCRSFKNESNRCINWKILSNGFPITRFLNVQILNESTFKIAYKILFKNPLLSTEIRNYTILLNEVVKLENNPNAAYNEILVKIRGFNNPTTKDLFKDMSYKKITLFVHPDRQRDESHQQPSHIISSFFNSAHELDSEIKKLESSLPKVLLPAPQKTNAA